jgi:hypothetical protein
LNNRTKVKRPRVKRYRRSERSRYPWLLLEHEFLTINALMNYDHGHLVPKLIPRLHALGIVGDCIPLDPLPKHRARLA